MAGLLGNPIGGKGEYKGSADELNVSGVYACEGEVTNIPSINGYLIHYNTMRNSMPCSQRYIDWKTNETWVRAKSNSGWSPWQRLDNFGYNTLEELASALKPILGLQ